MWELWDSVGILWESVRTLSGFSVKSYLISIVHIILWFSTVV